MFINILTGVLEVEWVIAHTIETNGAWYLMKLLLNDEQNGTLI